MQNQREKVLERFRMKKTRILVATDVAARGIDITGLSHVVNYSLPFDTATYVHRIGRTGRAGTTGIAVTFVRPEERRKLGYFIKNAERATKKKLTEEKVPGVNEVLTLKETRVMNELKEKLFKKLDCHAALAMTMLHEVPEKFTGLAAEICKDQDPQAVVASLLSIMYGEKLSPKHYGKISTKDMGPRGDQLRIFVSLGKKDGYRARELAEFFSNLLHIPGRMVDDIDVAQEFSLLSLPAASAKKAIEMSRKNKKLPHMHLDVKEEGGGRKRNTRRHSEDKVHETKQKRPSGKTSERSSKKPSERSKKPSSKKSGNDASAFVKKGKKAERF